jgi:DNA-binding NtrC family response regulator
MNQLENKMKSNKNLDGSEIAGVETPMENQMVAENIQTEPSQTDAHFSLRSLRAEAEIYAISRTLEYTGWNRRRAAQLLSISYRGILYKIRQHNLSPASARGGVGVSALEQQTVKVE